MADINCAILIISFTSLSTEREDIKIESNDNHRDTSRIHPNWTINKKFEKNGTYRDSSEYWTTL